MIALDASVLIAHFNPSDTHHHEATHILLDSGPEAMMAHGITLAEILVGAVRAGRHDAMLRDLQAMDVATAPTDEDEPVRLAHLRVGSGLKLPDCCVLDVGMRHAAVVATFDSALSAAVRRYGLSTQPPVSL
ncbi:hypothetical protein BH23ACT6_BH23ACT6_07650 [soil metagenome]